MASNFQYTKAVVRGVANSLAASALRQNESDEPVNLEKAIEQKKKYVETLKSIGLDVIEIPADERYPDCVFIEDPAMVIDNIALITQPGHETRRGETIEVKKTLESLGLVIEEVTSPTAMLDGGDVLFTGKEIFVGLTTRTNQEGADCVAKAYPKYHVSTVIVTAGLHLKSMMSMAGPNLLAIGESMAAQQAWKEIHDKGKYQYDKLSLPEDKAANCLYINGILVHTAENNIPKSIQKLRAINCRQYELDYSEFSKVDGCLTCCSLLIA